MVTVFPNRVSCSQALTQQKQIRQAQIRKKILIYFEFISYIDHQQYIYIYIYIYTYIYISEIFCQRRNFPKSKRCFTSSSKQPVVSLWDTERSLEIAGVSPGEPVGCNPIFFWIRCRYWNPKDKPRADWGNFGKIHENGYGNPQA
jgi:hypothetical protein